jgi:1-acyl-sn-glycerol-3-phosphate acyltransferase
MKPSDQAGEYSVPYQIRLFRVLMRPVFRLLFRILSRVHVRGRENVPAQGAYLIAINHISLFEPPLILAFWPTAPEAVGAVDIWDRRGQSALARLYGGIPVHRGEYDRKLLERMLAALKAGKPLLIAPEGGRSHTLGMRRALPGVAYVMDKARVPVVPVGILGTSDEFLAQALKGKRPQVEIRIGPPIDLPSIRGKGDDRRAARQENVDTIMRHIAALLPEAYHGVYAKAE